MTMPHTPGALMPYTAGTSSLVPWPKGFNPASLGVPFGPLDPLAVPDDWQNQGPRRTGYQPGYNTVYPPRGAEHLTPFQTLINVSEMYDTVRAAIRYWCEQLSVMSWSIVARPGRDPSQTQVDEAAVRVDKPDNRQHFEPWLSAAVDESLTTDALSIETPRTRRGTVTSWDLIDGATVVPKMDASGRPPMPPGVAFQQVVYGQPTWDGTLRDLYYAPKNPRTRSMYGRAPTEDLVLTINRALRRQTFDLSYYTAGNMPDAIVPAPESMNREQVRDLQSWFDNIVNAPGQRRKLHFVPGAPNWKVEHFQEPILDPAVEEFLDKRTLASFGIPPSEFGYTADVNRATSSGQENIQFRRRLPWLKFYARIITDLLEASGYPDVMLQFKGETPEEDALLAAQTDDIYIKNGTINQDDVRVRKGMAPLGVANTILTANGPVPLIMEGPTEDLPDPTSEFVEGKPAVDDAEYQSKVDPDQRGTVKNTDEASGEPAPAGSSEAGGGDSDTEPGKGADGNAEASRIVAELQSWYTVSRRTVERGLPARAFRWDVTPWSVQRIAAAHLVTGPLEARNVAKALTLVMRAEDDDTVEEHRDRTNQEFVAALAGLLLLMQRGTISEAEYQRDYRAVWSGAIDETTARVAREYGVDVRQVTAGAQRLDNASLTRYQQEAERSAHAAGNDASVTDPIRPNPLTRPQIVGRAAWVGGSLWAAQNVLHGAARAAAAELTEQVVGQWVDTDDERECQECRDLGGQSWPIGAIPQFPGDGGTECGGMCRCEITYDVEQLIGGDAEALEA